MDQLVAFFCAIACLIISCVPDSSDRQNLARNRRIFWTASCAALAFVFLGMLPDWKRGLTAALGFGGLMTFGAFIHTPYVKFRQNIYAWRRSDRLAESDGQRTVPDHDPVPDSYTGSSTANQTWWMMIAGYPICMFVIYSDFVAHHIQFAGIPAAIIFAYSPIVAGYWDSSWAYPIARGQRLQLVILIIMTAGIFAGLYFLGFYAGKRWPRRPKGSMEYRINARHWEQHDTDTP